MTSLAPPSTADRRRLIRLSRHEVAALLARPSVEPSPQDTHIVALPPGARMKLAAVLVPLIPRETEVHVLLTQRTPHLNDHPSQISFPGGRVEGGDENRTETALREAEEEIGLARDRVDIVGTLPDYDMPSGFRISPVVGWIEPPFELNLDPVEVYSAFEVPLSFVFDPTNHHRRSYYFNDRHRNYLAMPYQGHYIWGATAAMLYSLYRQLTAISS
jgi:8-oxo-dGTP pyrophosphatase MutT (NUDIX family)